MKILVTFAFVALPFSAQAGEGSAEAGAVVFKKCTACHSADQPVNKVGPHLVGIIDRPAASLGDYKNYSEAMKAEGGKGLKWDEAKLSVYLAGPKKMIPKTRMSFSGLKPGDAADVIAYLKTLEPAP